MLDLDTTTAAADTRIIRPADLVSALSITSAQADDLADEVSSRVVEDIVRRDLSRQSYTERVASSGRQMLLLARWPIESKPTVTIIDNGTVDADTFSVTGSSRHSLYRESGWALSAAASDLLTGDPAFPARQLYYSIAYTAGYLMPGEVSTWSASAVWGVAESASYGDAGYGWARSTDRRVQLRFEVTSGSGTVGTEPTWPTTAGGTVTASGVTFTARAAVELPAKAVRGALQLASTMWKSRTRDAAIKETGFDGEKIVYGGSQESALSLFRGL